MFKRVILFGDSFGIRELLKYIDKKFVVGIVGAIIRPQYFSYLKYIASNIKVPFIIQPKFDSEEYPIFRKAIEALKPDILICYSYSMLVRDDIRKIFDNNCINIHPSLLPKNRGPNPIQWSIIRGEKITGVTIHYMDNGFDNGDIIAQKEVLIDWEDTWVSLKKKLEDTTRLLLQREIENILTGKIKRKKQNEKEATHNFRLTPEFPRINLKKMNDIEIYNLIRAQVKPLRGAYIECKGQRYYFDKFIKFDLIKEIRRKYEKDMCDSST